MPSYDAETRTRTLARIVGPYLVAMGMTLVARQATLVLLFPAFMQDGPLVLVTGAFTLMAGLTMITAHHHWSSAAAIVISLIGVLAALKGAMLMIAPTLGAQLSAAVVRTPGVMLVAAALLVLVGLWLSFVGWLAKPAA